MLARGKKFRGNSKFLQGFDKNNFTVVVDNVVSNLEALFNAQ